MEALATIVLALISIVMLEAAWSIAVSLLRWTPCIALGALAASMSIELGASAWDTALIGLVACMLTRQLIRVLPNPSMG